MNANDLITPWETVGDPYNIRCPYCSRSNYYVTQGVLVTANAMNVFERPCAHCGKTIIFAAELVVQVCAKKVSGQ